MAAGLNQLIDAFGAVATRMLSLYEYVINGTLVAVKAIEPDITPPPCRLGPAQPWIVYVKKSVVDAWPHPQDVLASHMIS